MMEKNFNSEPYQPFFASGILISVLGLMVWVAFQLHWISFYPLQSHAQLMMSGFLFSYIYGFLMTAVPKMSQSFPAQKWEVWGGLFLLWLQVVMCFIWPEWSYEISVLQFAFILIFIDRRFLRRRAHPPPGFLFVPVGLLIGLTGAGLLCLSSRIDASLYTLGKLFLYQAFVLNLILGLGSRLVPALTRVKGALDIRSASTEKWTHYLPLVLLLNLSFLVEVYLSVQAGSFLKFLVTGWVIVYRFKIFHQRQAGLLGNGIRLSTYLLAMGMLLTAVWPSYGIHFMHISFIGGFALLTFLISIRVVLSHGGYDLTLEMNHGAIRWFYFLLATLAFLRLIIAVAGSYREAWIGFLFLFWTMACWVWSRSFIKKLLFQNKLNQQC